MRQRVVGATALSCGPDVLIADEPTTALDSTTQLAFLKVLKEIQASRELGILFITHDFGVVSRICDRVAVMYAGRIVETGTVGDIFARPAHPYTEALLEAIPDVSKRSARLKTIEGQPPSIFDLPPGCPFAPRCKYVMDQCRASYPDPRALGNSHEASCWRLN
jgi:oligopeptide/dipeptide ABC transporter ATP-binding protein